MAVTLQVDLPAQPAVGSVRYQPMGGDGWTSPKARYEVTVSLTQDASGGIWAVVLLLDPQFMNLVSLMQVEEDVLSDDSEFSLEIKLGGGVNVYRVSGDLKKGTQSSSSAIWAPPPLIDPLTITFRLLNAADTKIGKCNATIYVFNKSAQHVIPIEQIFRCLPRGGTLA